MAEYHYKDLLEGFVSKIEDVKICDVLENLKHEFIGISKALEIYLDYKIPKRGILLRGNRIKIAQALSGIVHNAFTFCSKGDSISVNVLTDAQSAYIVVRDYGEGICEAVLERIFEHDFPRRNAQSFSQDLHTIRRNIRALGGDVWAENAMTRVSHDSSLIYGACFVISLPLSDNCVELGQCNLDEVGIESIEKRRRPSKR